jgi:hypothetical protein
MSLESVLSEILGVPCGNVKFTREGSSQEFFECGEYLHSLIKCYLEFTTLKPLPALSRVGSLVIASEKGKYLAALLKGEETSRIARAVADELSCD